MVDVLHGRGGGGWCLMDLWRHDPLQLESLADELRRVRRTITASAEAAGTGTSFSPQWPMGEVRGLGLLLDVLGQIRPSLDRVPQNRLWWWKRCCEWFDAYEAQDTAKWLRDR